MIIVLSTCTCSSSMCERCVWTYWKRLKAYQKGHWWTKLWVLFVFFFPNRISSLFKLPNAGWHTLDLVGISYWGGFEIHMTESWCFAMKMMLFLWFFLGTLFGFSVQTVMITDKWKFRSYLKHLSSINRDQFLIQAWFYSYRNFGPLPKPRKKK